MEILGKIVIYILGSVLYAVFLKFSWLWFIVPLGVRPLQGYAHAFGVSLLVGYITFDKRIKDERSSTEQTFAALIFPLFALGFAALYHWCMG